MPFVAHTAVLGTELQHMQHATAKLALSSNKLSQHSQRVRHAFEQVLLISRCAVDGLFNRNKIYNRHRYGTLLILLLAAQHHSALSGVPKKVDMGLRRYAHG